MAVPVSPWYENPLFLTPAFGLLGVIVGGLITAGSSYLLDERREERDRRREDRLRTVNVITAARMIELDFRLVSAYLRVCIQNMAWSGLFTEPPSLPNWDRYCASVAPELSKEDWVVLVQAATGAVGTNFKRQFQKAQERTNKAIGEEELAWLRTAIVEPINKARDILLRLAGSETIELQEDSVTEGEDMDREERG